MMVCYDAELLKWTFFCLFVLGPELDDLKSSLANSYNFAPISNADVNQLRDCSK